MDGRMEKEGKKLIFFCSSIGGSGDDARDDIQQEFSPVKKLRTRTPYSV